MTGRDEDGQKDGSWLIRHVAFVKGCLDTVGLITALSSEWEAIAEGREGDIDRRGDAVTGAQARSEHKASGLHCHPPLSSL